MAPTADAGEAWRRRAILGLSAEEASRVRGGGHPAGIDGIVERTGLSRETVRGLIESPERLAAFRLDPNRVASAQLLQVPGMDPRKVPMVLADRPYFTVREVELATGVDASLVRELFEVPRLEQFDKSTGRSIGLEAVPLRYVIPPSEDYEDADLLESIGLTDATPPATAGGSERGQAGLVRVVEPTDFESSDALAVKSLFPGSVVPVVADPNGHPRYFVPGSVDIWFDPAAGAEAASAVAKDAGLEVVATDPRIGFMHAHLRSIAPDQHVLQAALATVSEVSRSDIVRWAEPTEVGVNDFETNSTWASSSFEEAGDRAWNLRAIDVPGAHAITVGSPSVTAMVIDSGMQLEHPDLRPALDPAWRDHDLNFDVGPAEEVTDPSEASHPHGTSVAGVVAGRASSTDLGIRGVAPAVWILPIKISGSPLGGSYGLRALAIQNAVSYLAPGHRGVLNLSWTTGSEHVGIREALIHAAESGFAIVTSAGNYRPGAVQAPDQLHYPSSYAAVSGTTDGDVAAKRRIRGLCSVAAVNASHLRATYSYFGPSTISFAAPGGEPGSAGTGIFVASTPATYSYRAGTSFAAPHVTGLLGLLMSRSPTIDAQAAIDVIAQTCSPTGDSRPGQPGSLGTGLVNARAALEALDATPGGSTTPAGTPAGSTGSADQPGGNGGSGPATPNVALVDVNAATSEQLASLPLLGPWTASLIVSEREANGPYRSLEDLSRTSILDRWAIGQLRPYLRVGQAPATNVIDANEDASSADTNEGRRSINTAGAAELALLPLLGEWTASRIVAYRTEHGPFTSKHALVTAGLIDEWTFRRIRDRISV